MIPALVFAFFMMTAIRYSSSPLLAQEAGSATTPSPESFELPSAELLETIDIDSAAEEENGFLEALQLILYGVSEHRQLRENHPLNPDDALLDFSEREGSIAADLDWTPELTDTLSLRSRVVGQVKAEDEAPSSHAYFLEGYLQWQNRTHTRVLDLGKVKTAWGSGYAWNPTQVLIFPEDEDWDDYDDETGVAMVRFEQVFGTMTLTALAARLDVDDVTSDHPCQLAAKASFKVEPWELSLVHHQATDKGWSGGLSFSGLLSDSIEIHGEWTRSELRDRFSAVKQSEGIQMGPAYLPERYDYSGRDRSQRFDRFLIGGQITFAGKMNLVIELYKTSHGYDDEEWQTIETGIDEANQDDAWEKSDPPYTGAAGNPYAGFLKNTMHQVDEGQLRQHYCFLRYTSGETANHWEWEQIALLNLDDSSHLHRGILHKSWQDWISTSLSITLYRGDKTSEYGLNPYTETGALEAEIRF